MTLGSTLAALRRVAVFGAFAAAAAVASSPTAALEAWVINPDGGFLAFDLASGKVSAAWNLAAVRGIGAGAAAGSAGVTGASAAAGPLGDRPVPDYGFATARDLALFAVPSAVPNDPEGRARYRVIAVRPPRFDVVAEWKLPQPATEAPRLLTGPNAGDDRLLVGWHDTAASTAAGDVFHLAELSLPDLAEVSRKTAFAPRGIPGVDAPPPLLTDGSRLSADGRSILDRDRLIRLEGDGFGARAIPFALNPEQRARLDAYSPPRAGRPSYALAAIDAEGGRVLYLVRSERTEVARDLVFTFDPATGVSTPFLDVPRCHAALLPGGRRIAVQEVEAPANRALSQTRTKGTVQVIDAASGAAVARFEHEALAGRLEDVRLRCASPDGGALIYRGARAELLVLDLAEHRVEVQNVTFSVDLAARCAFFTD